MSIEPDAARAGTMTPAELLAVLADAERFQSIVFTGGPDPVATRDMALRNINAGLSNVIVPGGLTPNDIDDTLIEAVKRIISES